MGNFAENLNLGNRFRPPLGRSRDGAATLNPDRDGDLQSPEAFRV